MSELPSLSFTESQKNILRHRDSRASSLFSPPSCNPLPIPLAMGTSTCLHILVCLKCIHRSLCLVRSWQSAKGGNRQLSSTLNKITRGPDHLLLETARNCLCKLLTPTEYWSTELIKHLLCGRQLAPWPLKIKAPWKLDICFKGISGYRPPQPIAISLY